MQFQKNGIKFGDYGIESHDGMELSGSEVGNGSFKRVQAL